VLEITQAAMDELGRPGRRSAGQVVHLCKQHLVAAPRSVARNAAAIDAAADHNDVVERFAHHTNLPRFRSAALLPSFRAQYDYFEGKANVKRNVIRKYRTRFQVRFMASPNERRLAKEGCRSSPNSLINNENRSSAGPWAIFVTI
jgi:hypothetical protein